MSTNRAKNIVKSFFGAKVPGNVRLRFYEWFLHDVDAASQEDMLRDAWNESEKMAGREDVSRDLRKVQLKIWGKPHYGLSVRKVLWRVAAAVMLPLLGAVCGMWLYWQLNPASDMDMVQCYVPFGETKSMFLPDGSEVTLAQGSQIIYPENFSENTREIYLSGKGRFAVKKDAERPFRVKTRYLSVTALGTEFLVEAYGGADETVATLLEGKVRVNTTYDSEMDEILLPNGQIRYDNNLGTYVKRQVDAQELNRLKEDGLIFRSKRLIDILEVLEKRYQVDIECQNDEYQERLLTVRFSENETLEQSMDVLSNVVDGLEYTIQGKKVIIK